MNTVATRLFLSYLAVVVVGLVVAAVAVGGLLLRYENDVARVRLDELTAPIVTSIQASLRQGRPVRDAVQAVSEQARTVDARVLIIVTNTRRVLIDSESSLEGQVLASLDPTTGLGTLRDRGEDWSFVQRALGGQLGT